MALRELSVGMTGEDVRQIQLALNLQPGLSGPPLNSNGVFDAATEQRVRDYQVKKGLPVTGVVDFKTRLALYPYGIATLTLIAMPLKMPAVLAPTPSGASGWTFDPTGGASSGKQEQSVVNPTSTLSYVLQDLLSNPDAFEPVTFRQCAVHAAPPPKYPSAAPVTPLNGRQSLLGFIRDHDEVNPGGQVTFPFGPGASQYASTITIQTVYQRGDDDGPNQQLTTGVQFGAPTLGFYWGGAPMIVNPFVQLTDVDRFGALGRFHYWQPYAQLGVQAQTGGDVHPSITGGLFPFNFSFDVVKKVLAITMAGGIVGTYDAQTGGFTAGAQVSAGLTINVGAWLPW